MTGNLVAPCGVTAVSSKAAFDATLSRLQEHAPVVPVQIDGGLRVWMITRHKEGTEALRDPRLVKDPRPFLGSAEGFAGQRYAEDVFAVEGRHMLNSDGADHTRLRKVAASVLSAQAVALREPEIKGIAQDLADGVSQYPQADLIKMYARPLPETVMARVLGIPEETMPAVALLSRHLGSRDNPLSPPMRRAYSDIVDLTRDCIRLPQAPGSGTMIAALQAAAKRGEITRREMLSTIMMLVGAGINSTAIAISQGAVALIQAAAAIRSLINDDQQAPALVEELLRHHPPFPFSPWRFARDDVRIGEAVIPAGAVVLVVLAAANKDPRAIDQPGELIVDRPSRRFSLTFGVGPHYCIGAHLARLEIKVALHTLFSRVPQLRLAGAAADIPWDGLLFDRTMTSLPVLTA
jgi:cytochrome P450